MSILSIGRDEFGDKIVVGGEARDEAFFEETALGGPIFEEGVASGGAWGWWQEVAEALVFCVRRSEGGEPILGLLGEVD